MPNITPGFTTSINIAAGMRIRTSGVGEYSFIATGSSGQTLDSGTGDGISTIGPYSRDCVVGLTSSTMSKLSFYVDNLNPVTSTQEGAHKVIAIGNSLTGQDLPNASSSNIQWLSNGLIANLNYKLYGRLSLVGVVGMSGRRSDEIAKALPDLLLAYPDAGYIIINAGENDVAQYITAPRTASDFRATMQYMIGLCLSAGITPIIRGITGSELFITTAGMADMWVACNKVLLDLARQYPKVIMLQNDGSIINLAAPYPAGLSSMCDGSFHPNSRGALKIALDDFAILNSFIPPVNIFPSHWHAGSANEMAYTGNPLMTGAQAATGGLTGNVPATGVAISVSGAPLAAVASLSQNSAAPTGSQWAKVAYQGPVSPVFATDFVRAATSSISLSAGNFLIGDVIQGAWEFDVDAAPVGFMGAEIFINFVGATGVVQSPVGGPSGAYSRAYGMRQNAGAAPLTALSTDSYGKGVLMTVPIPIPYGTTAIQLFAQAFPIVGAAGSNFNVYFGRHTYLKLG